MISFKDFLRVSGDALDANEFFRNECKPFIDKAEGAGLFYRGVQGTKPTPYATVTLPSGKEIEVGILTVRKDRRSRDLPTVVHDAFDNWMKEKFGIAGRSGSAFVVGEAEKELVSGYGEAYIVIPKGEFKFLWSPEVNDLFRAYTTSGLKEQLLQLTKLGQMEDFPKYVDGVLSSLKYQDTDLPAALKSDSEIMVECDQLLVVRADDEAVIEELKEVLK